MINFERLIENKDIFRLEYLTANPFPHLVIKDLCDPDKLDLLLKDVPELYQKSRDAIFAVNKFEKSNYSEISPNFKELYDDFHSVEMRNFISYVTCKKVFVDPNNHGGGFHQGKEKSKLDMHLDYNYHPLEKNWWRELNLLFYFSKEWNETWGGHLELEDLRTGHKKKLNIEFNSLIIQQCSSYSLHGYSLTNFPPGKRRLSIATYAFTKHINTIEKPRTTDWFPNRQGGNIVKQFLGRLTPKLINIKSKVLPSGTAKNK